MVRGTMPLLFRGAAAQKLCAMPLDKSAGSVSQMFCDIAGTYDLLNHVLSGNQDVRWRRRAIRQLCPRGGESILDLCCGTGDLTLEIAKQQPRCQVVGADFAVPMLNIAQQKGIEPLAAADALRLPFAEGTFDAATVAFGVRNFEDTKVGLGELRRVLKPTGRLMVLEFMRPTSVVIQRAFGAFNVVLAPLGRAISGHSNAYDYLPQSIGGFYTCKEFEALLREVGFSNVRSFDFSGGVATSFIADAKRR